MVQQRNEDILIKWTIYDFWSQFYFKFQNLCATEHTHNSVKKVQKRAHL